MTKDKAFILTCSILLMIAPNTPSYWFLQTLHTVHTVAIWGYLKLFELKHAFTSIVTCGNVLSSSVENVKHWSDYPGFTFQEISGTLMAKLKTKTKRYILSAHVPFFHHIYNRCILIWIMLCGIQENWALKMWLILMATWACFQRWVPIGSQVNIHNLKP